MIGHELGGRYEVIERIGGGGMALVYKAHDILLGRNVAIKVLRQQFVHDEEFIRRFRREAQSAASLSHSNVVSIYDVGQEDDIHYIVMEYVEGHNLDEIIKERAPLQVDEAVRIASQICDALDHAHQNQIIHRDIKPHNIMIGRNGRVKVTDFGIARAVTSTTITQTGSVVGSVHYFSPEHAKGVVTGEKSDLYSLGIVLYQMLTARLPFLGESPISVALKHLQEEFEEPREVNPLIPQSVENIILKSMRKNPQERYQSAKEMLQDLETCLLPERRNEPKIEFDDMDDEDRTRVIPAIKPQPRSISRAKAQAVEDDDEADEPMVGKGKPKKKKSGRAALWISLTLVVLLALAGVVWYVNQKLVVPNVTVPSVINMTEDQARKALSDKGLLVEDPVIRKYNKDFGNGVVYEQSRPEGTVVKEGAAIQLTVSTEKPKVSMPDVKNLTFDDARKALLAKGIKDDNIKQDEDFSDSVEKGLIISSDPGANAEIDTDNTQITLVVSKGQETIKMPDLIGKTQQEATDLIEKNGLKLLRVVEEDSYTVEKGKVIKQFPFDPNTQATPNAEITLTISKGYPADALNYTLNLPVAPVEEGKNTKIQIKYSDAHTEGKTVDWGTKTIQTTQVLPIDLVVDPNRDAVVTVLRDGQVFDTYSVRYTDVRNGTVPTIELPAMGGEDPGDPGHEGDPGDHGDSGNGDNQGSDETGFLNDHPGKGKGKDKGKGPDTENVIYR
ncbi:Stk1 family PASTA domain-containing Ser/Thr kinase [Paenibacillus sp. AR247]|uniref:Stk1 family PASTA domain-containing Ser/Thr kinase n=1 Tax=Paenibacillus sp. AR247 TaxID=1631599 RepID=UPI000CF98557|nr:Stk1 family PASTA domain-containing Ser/Thr kinase [Paenibacillus sp. AR247]PQP87743.1 serine/threonine protein kinase [Paenibacillus sp. AR247]